MCYPGRGGVAVSGLQNISIANFKVDMSNYKKVKTFNFQFTLFWIGFKVHIFFLSSQLLFFFKHFKQNIFCVNFGQVK